MSEAFSHYLPVATVNASVAERILGVLVDADVRMAVEPDNSEVQSLSAMQAGYGGTFGSGPKVVLHVHPDDLEIYESIHSKHFSEIYELPTEEEAPASDPEPQWIIGSIFAAAIAFYVGQHWWMGDEPLVSKSPVNDISNPRKPNPAIISELKESDDLIRRVLKEEESQDSSDDAPLKIPLQFDP